MFARAADRSERLVWWQGAGTPARTLDGSRRRWWEWPGGSLSYDANDRLTSDMYDANGNTISSGGISFAYNFQNQLVQSGGLTASYDGDGNRVNETVGGTTTQYLIDTENPTGLPQVMDELQNGAVTRTYAYGLERISENQLIGGTWTPSFYGYDGHGSTRFLTNMSGAVTDTYQYDAFGNMIDSTGTTPNIYLFAGEQFDSSLGLYDMRARYYRPATGRFWTTDPEEGAKCQPLSQNPYVYAWQDPVNMTDPTGRGTYEAVLVPEEITWRDIVDVAIYSAALLCVYHYAQTKFSAIVNNPSGTLHKAGPCEVQGDCPPCDPPEGTECYERQSGGRPHHGWSTHYHIWHRGQNPRTCECYWNKRHGTKGTSPFPPLGLQDCNTYPSWVAWVNGGVSP